jgi:hypothetical protein
MEELHYLLITDGGSDRVLKPIVEMTIREIQPSISVSGDHVDHRALSMRRARSLDERMRVTLELYGVPDVLFVHRDAEREPLEKRAQEIREAVRSVAALKRWVPVVPVRMQEAWLLADEGAIRAGAGNPNGRVVLEMPSEKEIEELPDPKGKLQELLREASGLSGRRRKKFSVHAAAQRVVSFMGTIEPLRVLPAFQRFEGELRTALEEAGA